MRLPQSSLLSHSVRRGLSAPRAPRALSDRCRTALVALSAAASSSHAPPVRHFVNLSNGAEALPLLSAAGVPPEAISFCRIQSSHCEAQVLRSSHALILLPPSPTFSRLLAPSPTFLRSLSRPPQLARSHPSPTFSRLLAGLLRRINEPRPQPAHAPCARIRMQNL